MTTQVIVTLGRECFICNVCKSHVVFYLFSATGDCCFSQLAWRYITVC